MMHLGRGFILEPISYPEKDDNGDIRLEQYDWEKLTRKPAEIVTNRKAHWFYIGTYEYAVSTTLDTTEFEALSGPVRPPTNWPFHFY